MSTHPGVESIEHERDFKILCDGLLRFELGPLIQTYGSDGSDGGVDAEFNGAIGETSGRWVFQYKFRSSADAISRRRSWLSQRYVGTKKKNHGEFDKEGVRAADGYILMTNIPVTVALVRTLTSEWRKRGHDGPLCIWDASRLNALMKGREHLARSWTGAKEARCFQFVILPLWQWVQVAYAVTADWIKDPLWPLEVQTQNSLFPIGAFGLSFAAKESVNIVPRTDVLQVVESDPQFAYASSIVYPNALKPFAPICRAVEVLANAVERNVDSLAGELPLRLPQLQRIREDVRSEAIRALAYCVLENRWGFPMRLHSIRDGKLLVHARFYAWDEPAMPEIEPILDELVREVPRGVVDDEVVAARAAVASLIQDWWERLWHVVSFGIDAERAH